MSNLPKSILVTGATGYVGGRLIPELLSKGYRVRCLVRDPSRLAGKPWAPAVDIVSGDALEPSSLAGCMQGIDALYYLIHSMSAGASRFEERDQIAAKNISIAAAAAGVQRIIYLGGLQPEETSVVSDHLQSRKETGDALRESEIPVTEFRAGVIIGSGSLSFELIRYLTERVPVMICPKWVTTETQPVAIRTVLEYLTQALEKPETAGHIYDIGARDVLSYEDFFRTYARVRNLRRWIVKVPVLTPELSARWCNFITPVPVHIARLLISGLRSRVVCSNNKALEVFSVEPLSTEEAIVNALERTRDHQVRSTWFDAFSNGVSDETPSKLDDTEGMIVERRLRETNLPDKRIYHVLCRLGGETGWLYANSLWKLRGFLDQTIGGVGYRRGRRSPDQLIVGDALDFWRVEAIEPNKLLRLRAEMKVPGRAWLEFRLELVNKKTRLTQTAYFEPRGLAGLTYWYVLYPIHRVIFSGMIDAIITRAKDIPAEELNDSELNTVENAVYPV